MNSKKSDNNYFLLQVKTWFQNRRMKHKKHLRKQNDTTAAGRASSPTPPSSPLPSSQSDREGGESGGQGSVAAGESCSRFEAEGGGQQRRGGLFAQPEDVDRSSGEWGYKKKRIISKLTPKLTLFHWQQHLGLGSFTPTKPLPWLLQRPPQPQCPPHRPLWPRSQPCPRRRSSHTRSLRRPFRRRRRP